MRKLKLLFLLCVSTVGGALSVSADDVFKDVTSDYLKNADFEGEYEEITNPGKTSGNKIAKPSEWTLSFTGASSDGTDAVGMNSSYAAWSNFSGCASLATGGNNTYWVRMKWNSTQVLKLYQTVTLPQGTYKLSSDYYKNGLGGDGNIYANTTEAKTNKNEDAWKSVNLTFSSDGESETEIGLKVVHTSSGSDKKLGFDNFKLEWNLTQSLKDLLTEANTFYTAEGDSYTALKSAIDAADAIKESSDASTLESQYNALAAALDLAKNHRKPWLTAWTTANTNYEAATYANVTGTEKTALKTEIDKSEPSTADDYDSAKDDLVTANTNFTAAKTNYDALVTVNGLITSTGTLSYADPDKKPTTEEATSASEAGTKAASQYTALRAYYESHAAAENVATAFDKTSALTNPNATDGNNGWTWTGTKNDPKSDEAWTDASGSSSHNYFDGGNWNGNPWTTTMSQTISLPVGTYLLTTKGRAAENTTLTMAVGAVEVALPHVGNSGNVFNRGWCDASLEFTSDGSDVTILVTASSNTIHEWFSIGDFRLVKLDATYADDDDYTALAAAISTIEGSLGFDDGEYAPYNVASALATAKAFDPNDDNIQSEVQDATAALEALSTNVGEVNAIYWKTDYTTADKNGDGYVHPIGWTNTGYNTRFLNDELSDETVFPTIDHAIMSKYNTTYGYDSYYTMPLKASTYYTLTFRYCGWGNAPETKVVIKDGSDSELLLNPSSFTPATSDGNSNADHWYDFAVTFKTNDAGNYKLELNKVPSGQQQIAWTNMNLIRANVTEVKSLLDSELTDANTLYNSGANVGTGIFQIPTASGDAFSSAITTAQGVYDNGSATLDQVSTAISNLKDAKTTYANATLNAPDSEKRYYLTVVRDGKDWDGNAITFMEGAANPTQGNYGIKYLTPANANMCQAVKFTNTTGNKYKVSFLTPAGTEQYITTSNLGYNAGTDNTNKERIRTVDDASKALEIEIQATTTANQFRLYNTDRGAVIADNDNNDIFTNNSANFTIAEASQASVPITIDEDVKFATRIFPFTPELPSGIEAYSCAEIGEGDILTLVKVAEPAANVPYILYSKGGYSGDALTGWGTADGDSKTAGLLTGVYTQTTAIKDTYVLLNKKDYGVGFYKVPEGSALQIGAYRCYLSATAGSRLSFSFDETSTVSPLKALVEGRVEQIYNASGARIPSLQKGLNIIKMSDGSIRKVMVK